MSIYQKGHTSIEQTSKPQPLTLIIMITKVKDETNLVKYQKIVKVLHFLYLHKLIIITIKENFEIHKNISRYLVTLILKTYLKNSLFYFLNF